MRVESALLIHAVSIPIMNLNTDFTLNESKHPGIQLDWDGVKLLVSYRGCKALIPAANIKFIFVGKYDNE